MKRKETNPKGPASLGVRLTATRRARIRSPRAKDPAESILQAAAEIYGIWTVTSGPFQFDGRCLSGLGYCDGDSPSSSLPISSLIHPGDRVRFKAHLDALLAGKSPLLDCEFRLRSNSGRYRWFQIRGKTIRTDRRRAPAEIGYAVFDIQASKERQRQAQASNELLTGIIQSSQDCIFVVDPIEFSLISFNQSFADVIFKAHGIRIARGMCAEDVATEKAEEWKGFYRQVLAQGEVEREHYLPLLKATHHILARCLFRDGRVYGICVFGHDVTRRKQMEAALRRSEEKFAKAFHEAPFPVALSSLLDNRYLDVNGAFVEASGYSREELIGRTPYDIQLLVHPEKRVEAVKQLQGAGEVRFVDLAYRTKSGEIRDSVASAARVDLEEEPCMLAVMMDVTDRKRATGALRESEERLRIAIEAGHMYAFEWDVATDVMVRSKQSLSMLDFDDDGSTHTKQELIDRLEAEDRQPYVQTLSGLTPEQANYKLVFRLKHRDGKMVWLEESGRALYGQDGKLKKVIGITCDVTEQREAERALRELSGRLITSQEEERRRIARELHDQIGQEAALICVQAQRLDSGVADKENTAHTEVHELYRRIKVLAGDISKLSHRLHSSELSFLGLTAAAERLCRDFADQYRIDMDFKPEALPPDVDSVRSLCLYRVLQESLQNVVKHSHASHTTVQLHSVGNRVALRVTDNGAGFDVAKASPGLGLLSMRERLNFVGGRFAISSTLGRGTPVEAEVPAQAFTK